jgi:hypothetical protein
MPDESFKTGKPPANVAKVAKDSHGLKDKSLSNRKLFIDTFGELIVSNPELFKNSDMAETQTERIRRHVLEQRWWDAEKLERPEEWEKIHQNLKSVQAKMAEGFAGVFHALEHPRTKRVMKAWDKLSRGCKSHHENERAVWDELFQLNAHNSDEGLHDFMNPILEIVEALPEPLKEGGRPKGKQMYADDDAQLFQSMLDIIAGGGSIHEACMIVAKEAKGGGGPESKAKRLKRLLDKNFPKD